MRIARSTGAFSGLLVMLLGIWVALIPFVGPYFDYSFGTNATWHYTTDRLWLDILPGALAFLGGTLLVLAGTRLAGIFGGWLAMLAGAWLVVGPSVSLTWEGASGPIGRPLFGSTRQMLELVGYFYGSGALILALSAFAVGRFASRPRLATEEAAVAAAPGERRAAPAAPAAPQREVAPRYEGREASPAPAPAAASSGAVAERGGEAGRMRRLPFFSRRRRAREPYPSERAPTGRS
jgi:hypothetical protein